MEGSRKNRALRSRSRSRWPQKDDQAFDKAEDRRLQIAEYLTLNERSTQKIGAFESYAHSAMFTVGISIACQQLSLEKIYDGSSRSFVSTVLEKEEFFRSAINIVGTVTALSGLYSATVFSVATIYGKTALSQSPSTCSAFLDTTINQRRRAFASYITATTCCGFQCVMTLSMLVPDTNIVHFVVIVTLGLLFAYYQIVDIKTIIGKASLQIFASSDK